MVASIAVMLLSLATAVSMCRVFADWQFLPTLVVMVVGLHAAGVLLRIARVPGLVALPLLLVVLFELLAIVFYRDTLRFLVPSGETFQLIRLDLRLVWSQFPTAVAPVPSEGSFLLAAAFGIGLVSLFADAFAFRAFGRAEAVVPSGVLFVFTAALGTDRNRILVAALWLAAAVSVVAVLRALHGGSNESWLGRRRRAVGAALPATVMCAGVVALGAALIGPQLPGAGSDPLLETRQSQDDATFVESPLVDIRSRLVNRSNTVMFTMSSAAGRYWRTSGLTVFDGEQWKLPDARLESADGELNPRRPNAQVVQQQITIARFGGKLLPAAFAPLDIAQNGLQWLPQTDTFVIDADEGLREGQTFNISSDVAVPTVAELRGATVSSPPFPDLLDLPDELPGEIRDLAAQVTAGAATPYDQARALQDWFRNNFTYDLTVQRGHGDDAILSFLRIQRGYCEQFAGTFAVMARAVGLPARVAVGFTEGELRADGRYYVLGRHAHAWPEVWFDGVGWVQFEPTPGRGAPGAEEVTGAAAAQDNTPATPSNGDGDPTPTASTTPRSVTPTTERDPLGGRPTTSTSVPRIAVGGSDRGPSAGGPALWVLVGLAVLGAWAALMPAVVRRFTRRGTTPTEQVIDAWHGTVGALQLAGAPPPGGATPIEYARQVEHDLAVDHRSLVELARFVTRAIYAPAGVGEPAALRAAVLQNHLDTTTRELMPWYARVWTRLDPRLVRQRLIGDRSQRRTRSAA
jgi:transglutaminase-like putative cysteine protease